MAERAVRSSELPIFVIQSSVRGGGGIAEATHSGSGDRYEAARLGGGLVPPAGAATGRIAVRSPGPEAETDLRDLACVYI